MNIYGTGMMRVEVPTIELPDPILPDDLIGPFLLFEWGDYDAGGGLNDLTGKYPTIKKAQRARRNENATIAVFDGGKLRNILQWCENEYDAASRARLRGWRRV